MPASRAAAACSVAPHESIAGKAIVCEMNNGESQTHFTSAYTGIKGAGCARNRLQGSVEVSARDY